MTVTLEHAWADLLPELLGWLDAKGLPYTLDLDLDDGATLRGVLAYGVTEGGFAVKGAFIDRKIHPDDVESVRINL